MLTAWPRSAQLLSSPRALRALPANRPALYVLKSRAKHLFPPHLPSVPHYFCSLGMPSLAGCFLSLFYFTTEQVLKERKIFANLQHFLSCLNSPSTKVHVCRCRCFPSAPFNDYAQHFASTEPRIILVELQETRQLCLCRENNFTED